MMIMIQLHVGAAILQSKKIMQAKRTSIRRAIVAQERSAYMAGKRAEEMYSSWRRQFWLRGPRAMMKDLYDRLQNMSGYFFTILYLRKSINDEGLEYGDVLEVLRQLVNKLDKMASENNEYFYQDTIETLLDLLDSGSESVKRALMELPIRERLVQNMYEAPRSKYYRYFHALVELYCKTQALSAGPIDHHLAPPILLEILERVQMQQRYQQGNQRQIEIDRRALYLALSPNFKGYEEKAAQFLKTLITTIFVEPAPLYSASLLFQIVVGGGSQAEKFLEHKEVHERIEQLLDDPASYKKVVAALAHASRFLLGTPSIFSQIMPSLYYSSAKFATTEEKQMVMNITGNVILNGIQIHDILDQFTLFLEDNVKYERLDEILELAIRAANDPKQVLQTSLYHLMERKFHPQSSIMFFARKIMEIQDMMQA